MLPSSSNAFSGMRTPNLKAFLLSFVTYAYLSLIRWDFALQQFFCQKNLRSICQLPRNILQRFAFVRLQLLPVCVWTNGVWEVFLDGRLREEQVSCKILDKRPGMIYSITHFRLKVNNQRWTIFKLHFGAWLDVEVMIFFWRSQTHQLVKTRCRSYNRCFVLFAHREQIFGSKCGSPFHVFPIIKKYKVSYQRKSIKYFVIFYLLHKVLFRRGIVPITCDELFKAIESNNDGTVRHWWRNFLCAESLLNIEPRVKLFDSRQIQTQHRPTLWS